MLPQHFGGFQIYEDKLVTTAENLHIAYRVARLLALSDAPAGEAADLLADAEKALTVHLGSIG
jgi:hypothetical protein